MVRRPVRDEADFSVFESAMSANRIFVLPFVLACIFAPALPCAGITGNPLTVLVDFESPHSEASLKAMRQSLNRLLKPTGIAADVEIKSELAGDAEFGQLVVFKMKGSCSLNNLPFDALSDERGPLAMAYTSDGQVLHFGEVECDRVRRCLQRSLGLGVSVKNQQIYGSALAIVIAHELYHMLGNAKAHTHNGITKAQLSTAELLDSGMILPPNALSRMQNLLTTPSK